MTHGSGLGVTVSSQIIIASVVRDLSDSLVDGPVLDPILVAAIDCSPKLNPLLWSPFEEPYLGLRDFLTWNMLCSINCVRSFSEPNVPWVDGRDTPATFPRVSSLRLVFRLFPWTVNISARDPDVGLTCGDVIDQLSTFLLEPADRGAFEMCADDTKRQVWQTYRLNRSHGTGRSEATLGPELRRCDWLGINTMFDGVEFDKDLARERMGMDQSLVDIHLPCVFVVRTTRRLTEEEEQHDLQEFPLEEIRVSDLFADNLNS